MVKCTVLKMHGDSDSLVLLARAKGLRERIVANGSCSSIHVVPMTGHMLVHYQAEELAVRIDAFLEDSEFGRSPSPSPAKPVVDVLSCCGLVYRFYC